MTRFQKNLKPSTKRHLWLCSRESPMKIFQNIPTCLQILDKRMEGDGEDINSLNNGSNHQHHTILVQVYRWNRVKNQFWRLCSLWFSLVLTMCLSVRPRRWWWFLMILVMMTHDWRSPAGQPRSKDDGWWCWWSMTCWCTCRPPSPTSSSPSCSAFSFSQSSSSPQFASSGTVPITIIVMIIIGIWWSSSNQHVNVSQIPQPPSWSMATWWCDQWPRANKLERCFMINFTIIIGTIIIASSLQLKSFPFTQIPALSEAAKGGQAWMPSPVCQQ